MRNYAIALSAGVISLIYCAYSAYLTGAIYILPKIDMFDNEKSSMVRNVLNSFFSIHFFGRKKSIPYPTCI